MDCSVRSSLHLYQYPNTRIITQSARGRIPAAAFSMRVRGFPETTRPRVTSLLAAEFHRHQFQTVGSGQWVVGSFDLFTVHCPLSTAHCPLSSEALRYVHQYFPASALGLSSCGHGVVDRLRVG